jgi:hypothetical protein
MSNLSDYEKGYSKAKTENRVRYQLKDNPTRLKLYNLGRQNLFKLNKILKRRSTSYLDGYKQGLKE